MNFGSAGVLADADAGAVDPVKRPKAQDIRTSDSAAQDRLWVVELIVGWRVLKDWTAPGEYPTVSEAHMWSTMLTQHYGHGLRAIC